MVIETRSIRAGEEPDKTTGALITPIYLSTVFVQEEPGKHKGFEYGRVDNPTRAVLEKKIASLEGGKFGLVFSSGQAAITATMLSMLEKGDHIVCSRDVYEGTRRLSERVLRKFGIETSFVDMSNMEKIEAFIRTNTRMIWLEVPSNPLLRIIDVRKVSNVAKKHGVRVIVDSTLATPCLQNPLRMGADVVLHSLTKFLGGHHDAVGGAIALNDERLYKEIKFLQHTLGAVLSPFDCYLILRGIKTLPLRMEKCGENALRIAEFLQSHEKIEKVIYPGLKSHPDYRIAKKQMKGFGGLISFCVRGGLKRTKEFLRNLRLISITHSFGGVETTIQHPASMMELSLPKREREEMGLTDNLVRLSVGLENVDELIKDLKQALQKI